MAKGSLNRKEIETKWIELVKKKELCSSTMKIARFVEKLPNGSNGTKGVML
jgi:hypothetical protein